jgi:tRNA dimethylallyltransferase
MLMNKEKIKVIALVGPTGVGKTEIGIALAEKLGTKIISCDSMQIYKHMNIGTAKPTVEQQKRVRHYLIDVLNPNESFDAAEYRKQASAVIENFEEKIPLIVGGTGFYLRALIDGLFDQPKVPKEFRKEIMTKWSKFSTPLIHEELAKVDPDAAQKIHPNDQKRILRALEVYEYLGTPISKLQQEQQKEESPFDPVIIGLQLARKELYARIDTRVVKMFENGWIDEVEKLRKMGYSPTLLPMQSLGYKYINEYLDGKCNKEDMIQLTQRDTRHYAKRQMTWFRADKRIHWMDVLGPEFLSSLFEKATST